MKDYQLTKHNLSQFVDKLQDELEEHPILVVTSQNGNVGKWGMARLWRAWMDKTAQFMAENGCSMPLMINKNGENYGTRPFSSDDAHELFTRQWMGTDADGTRLSWSKTGHDKQRPATKGERFNALQKHEAWGTERGIILFNPRDSEYSDLEKEQNS